MTWMSAGLAIVLAALQFAPVRGAISVSVIKAGTALRQPLTNARLELSGGPDAAINETSPARLARTDGNGRFVFSNLAPGEYRLAVTCDGFIRQETRRKINVGRGQPTGDILFELDPAPTAAGRVLDAYGEPIPNVLVEALRRSYDVRGNPRLARVATAVTDDRGDYRIFWLDPGEYFFYAAPALPDEVEAPPPRIGPTYYPGVTAPEDAMPLQLSIGRELRVDFRLRPDAALWSVAGHTMNALTGRPVAASITLTAAAEDPSLSRYHAQSAAMGPYAGQFSIGNVAPGSYIVTAKGRSGDQEILAFERIVLRPLRVTPPTYQTSLTLSPPVSIYGRLFVDSPETVDLREATVKLLSIEPDLPLPRSVASRPDGQFLMNGVVPGNYVLETSNLPQDLYLKAARFGIDDVLEKPLALSTRETAPPLQILLGSDGGRVEVAAYNARGESQSNAQFVLVPDAARRSRREQYRLATSDQDGRTTIRGIPPGTYKLFAWEQLEANAYLNAEFMRAYESYGTPVNVARGDNPPVSVRVISKE